uniref:DZF domain-containing protein n=1 Tax=Hippocampus comes TaxID=109280 RepID=A0A3Q2YB60_HIPCM
MAARWDEHQAYDELLHWDNLIQQGHRLLPHEFDRYTSKICFDVICPFFSVKDYCDKILRMWIVISIHSGPNDRRVMAKHSEIYPSAEELDAVQTIVSHVECALKALSEKMDSSDKGTKETKSAHAENRVMHGIMRVGLLAKGLLLKGDLNLELVLLCLNKPTITLLNQVAESLLDHLEVQQQRHG